MSYIVENERVCVAGDTLVPGAGNGYLLTPKTGVEAETNQHPKTNCRRQNPPVRLTDHTARRSCGKHSETIWDSELPGFGLRFRPPNGKSWVVFYRERGVQRTISLGPVSKVSAEEARWKARERLAANELDGLPTRAKARLPKSVIFADYIDEFLSDYERHWKPLTVYRNRQAIYSELMPIFGDMPLASIARCDVMRWRDAMASRSGVFNRTLPVLAVMLNYAEQLGYRRRGSNPCRGTPRFKRKLPERYLSPAEYRRLFAVLRDAEIEFPKAVAIIRLLIFTGARRSEIAALRWEYIKPPRLFLPDSKTGPKVIFLNRQAQAVIDALPTRSQSGLLFGCVRKTHVPFNVDPIWRILRKRAALPDVRMHDLRHSFASVAIRDDISLTVIGKLLGHSLPETTARYAHLADDAVMDAASRICSSIASAMGVKA